MIEISPAHLVEAYGLWAVFAAALLESMGLPLPSEGVLIAAAVIAGSHAEPSVVGLILAAASGAVLGDNIAYWIGRKAGLPILRRHGRRIGLDERRLRLGRYLFLRYGGRIVFFGRFISGLRTFAALLAGVNQMAFARFLAANAAGGLAWAATVGLAAYSLGAHAHEFSRPVLAAGSALAVCLLVALGIVLKRQEQRLQDEADCAFPARGPAGAGG
jgi:membrane protein DedA with SNARE-associated domain